MSHYQATQLFVHSFLHLVLNSLSTASVMIFSTLVVFFCRTAGAKQQLSYKMGFVDKTRMKSFS